MRNKSGIFERENTYCRAKYSRRSLVSGGILLMILLIVANVIAFSVPLLLATICLIIYLPAFVLGNFSKNIFSTITFNAKGIEWYYKGRLYETFLWSDFREVHQGYFLLCPTFDLTLSNELSQKHNTRIFGFESDRNILNVMLRLCTNETIVRSLKCFSVRY